ncbi:MAG: DUF551 domain-containing protein, partial [Thermodesulfobacteriota bacterium]
KDDSVLVYFARTFSVDMVHIEDYFKDMTNGKDEDGNQLYTKWYLTQGVTHWHPMPDHPNLDKAPEIFPGTLDLLNKLRI